MGIQPDNTDIVCKLYEMFGELSVECFDDTKIMNLCYDQLCIWLDGIDENMCRSIEMSSLTCQIYDSGLIEMAYNDCF